MSWGYIRWLIGDFTLTPQYFELSLSVNCHDGRFHRLSTIMFNLWSVNGQTRFKRMVSRRWNRPSCQFTDKLDSKYWGVSVKSPINHRKYTLANDQQTPLPCLIDTRQYEEASIRHYRGQYHTLQRDHYHILQRDHYHILQRDHYHILQRPVSHITETRITHYRDQYHTLQRPVSHITEASITYYRDQYHTLQSQGSHITEISV